MNRNCCSKDERSVTTQNICGCSKKEVFCTLTYDEAFGLLQMIDEYKENYLERGMDKFDDVGLLGIYNFLGGYLKMKAIVEAGIKKEEQNDE